MESLTKLLFDFDKLPAKLVLIVAILSGVISFGSEKFLAKIKLNVFNQENGHWVSIAFITSISFLLVTLLTTVQKKINRKQSNKLFEKEIVNNLRRLDPLEKSILREFYITSMTINLPANNATVVGLQDRLIIRLAQSNLGGSYFMYGFDLPFVLTEYAREVLDQNLALIDLPEPPVSEQAKRNVLDSRPPWLKDSWRI